MRAPSDVHNCKAFWKTAKNIEDRIMAIVYFLFELERLASLKNEKPIQKFIPKNLIIELIAIIDILFLLLVVFV